MACGATIAIRFELPLNLRSTLWAQRKHSCFISTRWNSGRESFSPKHEHWMWASLVITHFNQCHTALFQPHLSQPHPHPARPAPHVGPDAARRRTLLIKPRHLLRAPLHCPALAQAIDARTGLMGSSLVIIHFDQGDSAQLHPQPRKSCPHPPFHGLSHHR